METTLSDAAREAIRAQVMRAIALNREPGYHFAGNFIDIAYDRFEESGTLITVEDGPYLRDADGGANIAAVGLLADMALAATVRTGMAPDIRLATINLHLSFTGAPFVGRLSAEGVKDGRVEGMSGETWLGRVALSAGGRTALRAQGSFIVLPPPKGMTLSPLKLRGGKRVPTPVLEGAMSRAEKGIARLAEASLRECRGSFLRRFWCGDPHAVAGGAACVVRNGPHIANRVGHVQGGLLAGLALSTAATALPPGWAFLDASVSYISPGEGRSIRLRSTVVHHGRSVAVIRTQAKASGGKLVMEVTSTHAHRAHP